MQWTTSLAPPPGLEALSAAPESADILAAPPGLEAVTLALCKVHISGLPNKVISEPMLEVFLEQARLKDVVDVEARFGRPVGEVTIGFSSRTAAEQCVRHFAGCQWDSSGAVVKAEIFSTMEAIMENDIQEPIQDVGAFYGHQEAAQEELFGSELCPSQMQQAMEQSCMDWGMPADLYSDAFACQSADAWCAEGADLGTWCAEYVEQVAAMHDSWHAEDNTMMADAWCAEGMEYGHAHAMQVTEDPAFIPMKSLLSPLTSGSSSLSSTCPSLEPATVTVWQKAVAASIPERLAMGSDASTDAGESEVEEVENLREPAFVHVA